MEPYTHETLQVHCGPLVLNVAVCTKKKWTETFWTITTWDQKYSEFFSNAAADVPVWLHENNPGAISQTWHGFSRNVCNYMWDLYITTLGSFPLCWNESPGGRGTWFRCRGLQKGRHRSISSTRPHPAAMQSEEVSVVIHASHLFGLSVFAEMTGCITSPPGIVTVFDIVKKYRYKKIGSDLLPRSPPRAIKVSRTVKWEMLLSLGSV